MKVSDDLRRAVLQAAIQGKLTEQRAEDGTADELLEKIRMEKEKLIKEGKIKAEKELKPITEDEKPFEIPVNWVWCRLNSIYEFINGDRGKNYIPKASLSRNGLPFISAINLNGKTVVEDDNLLRMTEEQYQRLGSGKLLQNDVVLCIRGSLGKHGRFPYPKGAIASSLVILRKFYNSELLSDYLMIYLDSQLFFSEIEKYINGTAQPNLSVQNLARFIYPLPPLAEQHRIIKAVDALMSKIDDLDKAETELETMKKNFPVDLRNSLLQAAIQGKLTEQRPEDGSAEELLKKIRVEKEKLIAEGKIRPEKALKPITEDKKPFEIPDNWVWERWGNISFSIQYGYNAPALKSGYVKMVRISDIQNDNIEWESVPYCDISDKEMKNYILEEDDILFARTGGTVGKSYLVSKTPEKAVYAGYLIRTRFSRQISSRYIKYFMGSNLYWIQLKNGTTATAQPNCNGKTLSQMIVPLPPLAEQHRIVKRLDELLPLCEAMKGE